MHVILLAGGRGERFWPASRKEYPKQLLKLYNGKSLFDKTIERFRNYTGLESIKILCNKELKDLMIKENRLLKDDDFIIEPYGKNTFPAIMLALSEFYKKDKNSIVFFSPVDHLIDNVEEFVNILKVAETKLREYDDLFIFGIKPEYPATGFGYIEKGEYLGDNVYNVLKFKEKPDFLTAEEYIKSGKFVWNSGMFLGKTASFIESVKKYMKNDYELFVNYIENGTLNVFFDNLTATSIDYAIMEKEKNLKVIECFFDWNDMGNWISISSIFDKDEKNNRILGNVVELNSNDLIIANFEKEKIIGLIDLENIIVVNTKDALLICSKNSSEKVKELLKKVPETYK